MINIKVTPEVSVIMPAHNTEAYIGRAIESARNQTLENIEIIVVDDGSTDGTADVVRAIKDRRLRVITNNRNLGAGASRQVAQSAAKGKWIAILDSDDWFAAERLEILSRIGYAEGADMVADDLHFVREPGSEPYTTLFANSGQRIGGTMRIDPVYYVETSTFGKRGLRLGWTKPLIRRSFIDAHGHQYDGRLFSHDFWFYFTCLLHGARFVVEPQPYYYYYRLRQNSLTGILRRRGQVERLTEMLEVGNEFLECTQVKKNDALVRALSTNLRTVERYLAYHRVVDPLKRRQWLSAFVAMPSNPYFFVQLVKELPRIVKGE